MWGFFADVPLPGVVHSDVTARTLQQLFLCLSPAGHRHGREDATHHPVLRHAQRQTGNSSNANADIIISNHFLPATYLLIRNKFYVCISRNDLSGKLLCHNVWY